MTIEKKYYVKAFGLGFMELDSKDVTDLEYDFLIGDRYYRSQDFHQLLDDKAFKYKKETIK